jgi:hypothetical protein
VYLLGDMLVMLHWFVAFVILPIIHLMEDDVETYFVVAVDGSIIEYKASMIMDSLKQKELTMLLRLLQDSLKMRQMTWFRLVQFLKDLRCMRGTLMFIRQ